VCMARRVRAESALGCRESRSDIQGKRERR
jgi:hypothetical protein